MAGVGCVMLSGIPRQVRRPTLQRHFMNVEVGGGPIEYILHPLGNDLTKAVIKFTEDKAASAILQHEHVIEGSAVSVAPLPRQVLSKCTATVDPSIMAGLPDLVACMDLLRNDFGVKVHYDPLVHVMSMTGSFLQLQFAQAALSTIYRQEEEMRQRALTEAAEKVLDVPFSVASPHQLIGKKSSPASVRSDDFDSPPRTLRMEDLAASQAEQHQSLDYDRKPTTPRTSTRSSLSTSRSVASTIAESSMLQSSTSSKFKPYRSVHAESGTNNPEESMFSKNAKTVDDMFSSSMPNIGAGPKPSESVRPDELDNLSSSGELLNTWGSIGSSGTKVVVEFDTQVFNFMRRVHGQSLKDLEKSYRVQLQYKKSGDVTMVRILPAGNEVESIAAIHQAKSPLINLYHSVFKDVVKIVVSLEKVSSQMTPKVDTIVAKIKESYKGTLYIDMKEIRKRLTLVGLPLYAEAAEEKLRKALDLKKDRDIIKPKMVFMMQSQRTSAELAQSQTSISSFFNNSSRTPFLDTSHGQESHVLSKSMPSFRERGASPILNKQAVNQHSSMVVDVANSAPCLDEPDVQRADTTQGDTTLGFTSEGFKKVSPRSSVTSPHSSIISPRGSTRLTKEVKTNNQSSEIQPMQSRGSPKSGYAIPREDVKSPARSITSPLESMSPRGTPVGDVWTPRSSTKSEIKPLQSPRTSAMCQHSPRDSRPNSRGSSVVSPREGVAYAEAPSTLSRGLKVKPTGTCKSPPRVFTPPPIESVFSPRIPERSKYEPSKTQTLSDRTEMSEQISPQVAWPTPEPIVTTRTDGLRIANSVQFSTHTSMTGVTPLTSTNLSATRDFSDLSPNTTSQSLPPLGLSQSLLMSQSTDFGQHLKMSQSLDLQPLGSSTMRDTSRSLLNKISFMSSGELHTARSEYKPPVFKFATKEGVKVSVYTGKITDAAVGAVICPSKEDLRLLHGIALDISQAAGHQLQEACTTRVVEKGYLKVTESYAVAASGALACHYVVLAACPMWCLHPEKVECEGILTQTLLKTFISIDEELKVESIALPAVGTGEHGIPPDVCGWALLAAIEEFSSTVLKRNLKEIHVINADNKITQVIGDTLEEVLHERGSNQITPLISPHDSRRGSVSQDAVPFIIRLLAACVSIAEKSGGIIRDIMKKGDLGIVEKGINDLQTEADRSAERCIVASLHAQFPGLVVVGEEGTSSVQATDINPDWLEMSQSAAVLTEVHNVSEELKSVTLDDVVVWVDPLDGTSEYTQGLVEHVTTLIGIAVRGHSTAGVIHQPFYGGRSDSRCGRSVWGIVGIGAFGHSKHQASEGQGNNVIVTTRSHGTGAVGEAVAACEPSDVVRAGGCGHKVLMVLEGRAHAYVFASPGCKKWDTAAPEAVLQAAGGMLTDVHGNKIAYLADVQTRNSAGVVATPAGANHNWYIDHIPEDVKASLPELMEAGRLSDAKHQLQSSQDLQPFIVKLLAACVSIAEKSGSIIRDIMKKGDLGIVEKGINDLQTEADRSAERCIVASLHAQFPGLVVVGEEGTSSVQATDINPDWLEMSQSAAVLTEVHNVSEELKSVTLDDVVVWVDPLDGTSEYTQGLVEHVTTLIGIAVRGHSTAGVIHQPFYGGRSDSRCGRSVWGIVGIGAFGHSKHQASEGQGNNVIVTTRSHGTGAVGEAVAACEPSDVVRAGGCGHKVLMVLEGRAHAYVFASPGCKKWDTAAPEAVLQAAGGMLTDVHGNKIAYLADVQTRNSAGVVATPAGANHNWYIDHIPEDVKASLPEVMEVGRLTDPRHKLQSSQDMQPFIIKLLAACVSIAEKSGSIIRDIMKKGDLGIVEKGINDLQTEADRSAERCIVASLHAQFPGLVVVGEEGTSSVQATDINPDWLEMSQSAAVLTEVHNVSEELKSVTLDDVVVWVDPLDGTSEYTQGLVEHVTTLIGIAVRGHSTAGVIHQPFYGGRSDSRCGRSVWGIVGIGAFGHSKNQASEGQGNNVIVTTRSHGTGAVGEAVAACEPSDVVRAGGCGHKVLMVLEGRAHAYVFASPGCKKWDTAAPEAVLQAAGGMLTDVHGNKIAYLADVQTRNSAGVVATPAGANHNWYIDHIPEDVKASLPEVMEAGRLTDPRHKLQISQDLTLSERSKDSGQPLLPDTEDDINTGNQQNMLEKSQKHQHPSQDFNIGDFDIGKEVDKSFGKAEIRQPGNGTMSYEVDRKIQLPGFSDTSTLVITYAFFTEEEPLHFTAYLPNNERGRHCLQLLRKAFNLRLIFKSVSRGESLDMRAIIWSDIPHKERIEGGKEQNGYPDAEYLDLLERTLQEKGIMEDTV